MASSSSSLLNLILVFLIVLCSFVLSYCCCDGDNKQQRGEISALGDPGMKRDGLRVAFEAWNFCNEVGSEVPGMGSPRAADCFDLSGKYTYFIYRHKLHCITQSKKKSHFFFFFF